VITLQTVFGYDVDGMTGPATLKLLEQQVGYGWQLEMSESTGQTNRQPLLPARYGKVRSKPLPNREEYWRK
jgi:hypothetical protein